MQQRRTSTPLLVLALFATTTLLVAFVAADSQSLFFAGQFVLSNTTVGGSKFSSFGEIELDDDGEYGTFQPTGMGIFESSTVTSIAIAPGASVAYLVGDFLWANRLYSSIVVQMDLTSNNLSPMGSGIATTGASNQYVTMLQSGNAVVGGSFSSIETAPHVTFPNLATFQVTGTNPLTGNWVQLYDPTNTWSGRRVNGLTSFQEMVFVYGEDQTLYQWQSTPGFQVISTSMVLDINSLIVDTDGNLYATHNAMRIDGEQSIWEDTVYMWAAPAYANPPQARVVRSSTVGCPRVLLQRFYSRIIAAIANDTTCNTWHFGYLADNNTIVSNAAPLVNNVVTHFATSKTNNLVVSGPQNSDLVVESLLFLSDITATQWQSIDVGMQNFVVKSIAYADSQSGFFADVVDVESLNRTMLFYSPNAQVLRTVISDQQLVKPGIVTGIAQLSSGEIAVAGKFTFAGTRRFVNAAVLNGNDWSDLSFQFPPKANLPSSAIGLAASGNSFFTAGDGVMLVQGSPLPFYTRTLKSNWALIPNCPTTPNPSNKPLIAAVYAAGDNVYFGGVLNAQIGSEQALGLVQYNTKSKSWRAFGISNFSGIVRAISQWSNYLMIGGPFEFTVNGVKYTNTAAYNLSNNTWLAPSAPLTGVNNVYAFGWYSPAKKAFVLGNLLSPLPPQESTGALMYNYPQDSFTNAPISPPVLTSAFNKKNLYIGGGITGTNFAGVARWSGTAWTALTQTNTPWFFEGTVNALLLPGKPEKAPSSHLPGWAIALITIASLVGAALLIGGIAVAAYVVHKRHKNYETL